MTLNKWQKGVLLFGALVFLVMAMSAASTYPADNRFSGVCMLVAIAMATLGLSSKRSAP